MVTSRAFLSSCVAFFLVAGLGCAGDDAVGDTDALTTAFPGLTSPGGASATTGNTSASGDSSSDGASSASSTGDGGSASATATSSSSVCGDGMCSADEGCVACSEDCGACESCDAAPICPGDPVPPQNLAHMPSLDIEGMDLLEPDEIRARLTTAVDQGDDSIRLLAAALAAPEAGEDAVADAVRGQLDARPELRAALLRSLVSAGMGDPVEYRDAHPRLHRPELRLSPPSEGAPRAACSNPHMRVRVARLDVIEEDDDFANDIVYCIFTTEAKNGAEVRVTEPTTALDEGDHATYTLSAGVIWGQEDELRAPGGNLLITYDCFEQDTESGFADLLDALGGIAKDFGGLAGTNGWIFDGAGGLAQAVAMALALDGDDHLLTAQNGIDAGSQIEAANGVYWIVDRSGVNLNSDWHWQLRMEAWGCAEG